MSEDPLYHDKTNKIINIVDDALASQGFKRGLDNNILILIDALNRIPGVHTNWSCGGHSEKKRFPFVSFTFDDKSLGIENLAKIASVAEENGWILSVNGHFHWDDNGGCYIYEFELYPKMVVVLGGAVRGSIEKSSEKEIESEQAKIDQIAKKISDLMFGGKRSILAPPNKVP